MSKELQQAINYFKNRTSFDIPVYEKEQFKTILKTLEEKEQQAKELKELKEERAKRSVEEFHFTVSSKLYGYDLYFLIKLAEEIKKFDMNIDVLKENFNHYVKGFEEGQTSVKNYIAKLAGEDDE
jgi:uncharacterized membrane protein YhiD involved in acid resistance